MIKLAKFPINYKPISRASPPEMGRSVKAAPTDLNPAAERDGLSKWPDVAGEFKLNQHTDTKFEQPPKTKRKGEQLSRACSWEIWRSRSETRKGVQNINQTASNDRFRVMGNIKSNRKTPANLVHGFRCDSDSDSDTGPSSYGLPPLFEHNLSVVSIY